MQYYLNLFQFLKKNKERTSSLVFRTLHLIVGCSKIQSAANQKYENIHTLFRRCVGRIHFHSLLICKLSVSRAHRNAPRCIDCIHRDSKYIIHLFFDLLFVETPTMAIAFNSNCGIKSQLLWIYNF